MSDEVVETQVVIGMRCDICGPLRMPPVLLTPEEAKKYQEMHWLAMHPGIPKRSEREQVMDGQHREGRSRMASTDNKEN